MFSSGSFCFGQYFFLILWVIFQVTINITKNTTIAADTTGGIRQSPANHKLPPDEDLDLLDDDLDLDFALPISTSKIKTSRMDTLVITPVII